MRRITRIAPTPSGFLHVGNAYNAILIWLWARRNDASILLRIDDLDRSRYRVEYLDDVFRTFEWLGIDWDLGPQSVDDFNLRWSQSNRIHLYDAAIASLEGSGLTYRCLCSRAHWLEHGYNGCACSGYSAETLTDAVIRLKSMPATHSFDDQWHGAVKVEFESNSMSSVVRRRDGLPSYQIASTVDDVDYEITDIIRGADLLESSAFQHYLSDICGLPAFRKINFMHHPLVTADGSKLSKSAGATSLKHLRDSGVRADQFYLWMSRSLGVAHATNATELLELVPDVLIPSSENLGWTKG